MIQSTFQHILNLKERSIKNKLLIYGTNGYTGELTARLAAKQGLQPILAGRNEAAVSEVAERLDFEARPFSLDDADTINTALNDVAVVLHCAGLFIRAHCPTSSREHAVY